MYLRTLVKILILTVTHLCTSIVAIVFQSVTRVATKQNTTKTQFIEQQLSHVLLHSWQFQV